MKKILIATLALVSCVLSTQAQYFTNGNLAVVRIGGPGQSVTTSDDGNSVSIDQYTTSGTLVSSLLIPSNGPNALVLNGSAYTGYMTLTPDGTRLVIGGFNTSTPYISNGLPANVGLTSSTNVPRAIATIDGYGNYALPIVNFMMFNTYTLTGVASDGSNFWATGTGATTNANGVNAYGVVYCGTPAAPATNEVLTGLFSAGRSLNIFNNTLYVTAYTSNTSYPQAGGFMLANNAGALPTTAAAFSQAFQTGTTATSTPSDLAIDPAGTTAYLADYSFGIVKFTYNGSAWVSNYTVYPTNTGYSTASGSFHAISLTADFTQNPPVVYATTGETITNRLVMFQDTGMTPTVINLASNLNVSGAGGMTNTFRGVRFVPGAPPLITVQPASAVQPADGSATFSVTALGTPSLSYQWYTNGRAVTGATTTSLTLNTLTTFQNGTLVTVVVTGPYGTVTSSNATLTVNPNYFIPGNLAVVSVGGTGQWINATNTGNTVSIVQFTTSGSQVSTLPLPSTGPNAFVLDGSATEAFMGLTGNGQYLVLGGYNAALPLNVGTNILEDSVSSNAPRAVVTIDGYGNYVMQIANTNVYNEFNIRGAAFDGTNNFWVSGGGSLSGSPAYDIGVIYVGTPGSTGVNVRVGETGTGNERCLNIYNNTLYVSTGSSTHGIFAINGPSSPPPPIGTPTNTPVQIISMNSSSGPYDFVFNTASNICYVADANLGGIVKFTLNAGTWVSNYTLSAITTGAAASGTNAGGVTADFTQNPPVIYATTTELAGNRLISIVDNGAGSPATLLAQATSSGSGSNYFRGVRFVPGVPPSITNNPASFIQDAGGDATFTVGATGTPTLTYQWYTNTVLVAGATSSSLTLASVDLSLTGSQIYAVVANNYGTATSSGATLTVQPPGAPLNISILPPTSLTVNAGSTATFSVSAVGTSLTFLWSQNGVQVASTTSTALAISPAYATANGTYTVLASNTFGTAPGNNSATLTVIDPVIVTQPVGSTNLPNTSGSLSVVAAGAPSLTYQWRSNGVAIAGATTSALNLNNSGATVAASYSVIVSNGLGNSVTSAATIVSFTPLLLNDTFSYPNGNLFGDAGSPWTDINGTNPEVVTNGRVQINQTNYTTDAQSLFSQPEGGTVIWVSFIINLTSLPTNAGGVYFANIEDLTFNFFGRIFALTSNQPAFTPGLSPVAFPGTYRLGIADTQNDAAGTLTTGPNAVVPLDLAPGVDYQVVYYVDLNGQVSGMAVNPASKNDVTAAAPNSTSGPSSGPATDAFLHLTNAMAAFGLRQREGGGVMQLDNLEVSFDWNGAGSGYSAVTGGIVAAKPVIGLQPAGTTNFSGNPYVMEVAASGIGTAGVGLTYAWYQNGVALSDGASVSGSLTPSLTLSSLVATNSGTYYVVVTGATGGPVQSSNAVVSVNTTTTAPSFTVQPAANTTNSEGGNVTFTSLAVGTGPITYDWFYFSSATGLQDLNVPSPNLTLTSLSTNQAGTYYAVATGGTGLTAQSSNAVLIVNGPQSVTIGYLRSLLNPTTYQPSDTTTLFSITGVITTSTNQTTGNTASYYIQDATGGINLFITDGQDFRPALGDLVTATGVLSTYVDNYELDVTEGAQGYVDTILGSNAPLPAPILFPWGNTAPLSPFLSTNVEGSVVVLTNLYFELGGGTNTFASGTDYIVTNNTGQSYTIFVSDQDTNYVTGQLIPFFAYSIAGPLIQDDATIGITFTVYSNLVSAPPPQPTAGAAVAGANGTNNVTLSWTAVPYSYTYGVLYATNVQGPWASLASGLWFSSTNGAYTDAASTSATKYYQIISP